MNRYPFIPVFLIFLTLSSSSLAVPATNEMLEMMQPDGTIVLGHLLGDEHFSWMENLNQDIIIRNNETGYMEYATLTQTKESEQQLVRSGFKVVEKYTKKEARRIKISGVKPKRHTRSAKIIKITSTVKREDMIKMWELKQKAYADFTEKFDP